MIKNFSKLQIILIKTTIFVLYVKGFYGSRRLVKIVQKQFALNVYQNGYFKRKLVLIVFSLTKNQVNRQF